MKKIVVNPDKCICCGACVSMCSDVFDFSDEVKEEALDALEGCPVGAIEEVESEEEAA
jgi:ferredoxin